MIAQGYEPLCCCRLPELQAADLPCHYAVKKGLPKIKLPDHESIYDHCQDTPSSKMLGDVGSSDLYFMALDTRNLKRRMDKQTLHLEKQNTILLMSYSVPARSSRMESLGIRSSDLDGGHPRVFLKVIGRRNVKRYLQSEGL